MQDNNTRAIAVALTLGARRFGTLMRDAQRNAGEEPPVTRGVCSRRTIDRLIELVPPRYLDDERGLMRRLDLELERARRYSRPFTMTRFQFDPTRTSVEWLSTLIADGSRTLDAAGLVLGDVVVIWADDDLHQARTAIERLVTMGDGRLLEANSVAYPRDALTKQALLERLFETSVPSDTEVIVPLRRAVIRARTMQRVHAQR